jgi:ketosteroid isomerase-like protein
MHGATTTRGGTVTTETVNSPAEQRGATALPRDIVTRFYAHFDAGDIDAAVSLFSADLETIDPGMGVVRGIQPFRGYLETLKRALPDAQAVVEQLHDAGDTVIVEGRFVGTHTGPLIGPDGHIAPTGERVDLRFADLSRVRDGASVSYRTYYDQLGLLTQLGLMDDL